MLDNTEVLHVQKMAVGSVRQFYRIEHKFNVQQCWTVLQRVAINK